MISMLFDGMGLGSQFPYPFEAKGKYGRVARRKRAGMFVGAPDAGFARRLPTGRQAAGSF